MKEMNASLFFLALTCAIALFIILVVGMAHNVGPRLKLYFAISCSSLILWQLNIYMADGITTHLRLWNNVVFLWPTLAIISTFSFTDVLQKQSETHHSRYNRRVRSAMYWLTIADSLLICSAQLFTSVTYRGGNYAFTRGWAYPIFIGLILAQLVLLLQYLFHNFLKNALHSRERKALGIILRTIGLVSAYSVLTNVIVPLATGSQQRISWGILSIDFFALGFALSIIRYRFLDIRSYAFTAAVYALSIATVATAYVLATSLIIVHVFAISIDAKALVIMAILTLIVAVTFQPIRLYFNRLTSRLFHRDAYSPQDLFNRLNASLVGAIRIEPMLNQALSIIQENVKSDFAAVEVLPTETLPARLVSTKSTGMRQKDIKAIETLGLRVQADQKSVLLAGDASNTKELRKLFVDHEIEAIAPMHDATAELKGLGYLVFGAKRSGNPYSRQDITVIETIANVLVLAIQNALRFEEIENFNRTLQQKIDEATHKLQRTNQKLRLLDETKDDFISMASHQLRTPLTSVKGYVSMVLDGDAGSIQPLQRKLLNQAFISSQRMVYLISDLLNVSRLRTGKFVIEPMATNLAAVVKDEVEQLLETAKGRNVELIYHRPDDFPALMLDEIKMRQVIMNFLDNAIYYTPSGGRIEVRLEDKPESVSFTVVDTGMGVPRAEQHHLFSKFFRADNAKRARPDGTGLGLFMAKKVVVAQGGAIVFKSKEGEGSTFGFTFAKSKLPPLAPRA